MLRIFKHYISSDQDVGFMRKYIVGIPVLAFVALCAILLSPPSALAAKGSVRVATGLSVDVDMNIPKGRRAGRYDIAVVIGNKSYALVPEVAFADRDALIMREYLVTAFGFSPENVIFEENATVSKMIEIFGKEGNHDGRLRRLASEGRILGPRQGEVGVRRAEEFEKRKP